MPYTTVAGAMLLRLFNDAGAKPYPQLRGKPSTSKVARLVMPNGNPVAIQTNCKKPRVWLLPHHERAAFKAVGEYRPYAAGDPRHHHLDQVTEFVGQAMTKVAITSERWLDIGKAVQAVCS